MKTGKFIIQVINFIIITYITVFSFSGKLLSRDKHDSLKIFVISYNIRVAVDEGVNSWENRKEKVASMIRFHHADIIGMQEALKKQITDLLELLPEYGWAGAGRDDGKEKGEYSPIFFKINKFELIRSSTFWLSDTPDTVSIGWDAALPRIVTWVLLKETETGKMFYHFNTHFDHVGVEARKNSAKLLIEKINEISKRDTSLPSDKPVVITGDFNSRPESEVYKILSGSFLDAKKISRYGHYGSLVSFNGFGKLLEEGNIIDFIFVNNKVNVEQHGIVGDKFDGSYPSDHMPVISEVVIW